jgi:cysteine desulfurase
LLGLEEALTCHPRAFVAAMLANNETGVLWPIAEIAALVHRHGGLLHCDASQAFGRMPVDIDALGADFLTVSAHKMGGPLGAAALVLARDQAIVPLLQGGGQERGRRAGTENGPALVGFAAAILDGYRDWQKTRRLRDHLEDIVREVDPRARIFGEDRARLDNTTCFALSAGSGHSLVIACDLAGIGISAGAACSSGTVKPSRVLQAMGVDEATARRALRISLGPTNTEDEVSRFRQVVRERCGMLESAA